MKALLNVTSRYAPLISAALLLMALISFAPQLGLSAHNVDSALGRVRSVYTPIAAAAWLVVIAGLIFEWRVKPGQRKRGWMMDVLSRLTNRGALEQMLQGQDRATFIDADALAAQLKAKIIGQDAVCDDIAAQIRRRLALTQRGKPVGIFLLAGPPGTGKTYLGSCLARFLDRRLLSFDMTAFSAPHAATQLFGSPKGYVGSDSYGRLTNALKETPDAVVLLDEFEKAHGDVHKKFLTAWNDGYVTEASDGRQIPTSRAIFVLTSNAATEPLTEIVRRYRDNPDEMRSASIAALRAAGIAPEVLNRLDRVFVFQQLEGLDVARVAALEIEQMIRNYDLSIVEGGIDAQVLFGLMMRQERLGASASARDLVRTIEEQISDSLITAKQRGAKSVSLVGADDGSVQAVPAL
jgi:ATP-dependent Clp protease ATP-binding subunit ClpA